MLNISNPELSEKDRNQLQILDELISGEKVSASDIVSKIGISAATISRVFRNLKEKELIKYLGK
ncbi:MarR family transcriptional regulator, partial [Christensenella minuta]